MLFRPQERELSLYPHQKNAQDLLRQSLVTGHKRPLLMMPTGAGKTECATSIIKGALAKGKRSIFVVPAISLIDQTVERFGRYGVTNVGVIQADHPLTDYSQPVQVASVQTLMRRKVPAADLVICDEAHLAFSFVFDWMADPAWQRIPFVGLSATPYTKGLGKHYDDLLIPITITELIDGGFLSPFRVWAPSHPDLSGVKTVAGDYHESQLAEAMNKPQLTADVVEQWLKLADWQPTLCFAVNRAHAKALQKQFEAAGVPAGYVDGMTPPDEREAVRRKFHDGSIKVVCNIGVLTTGIDWDVRCISFCRPTKSKALFQQIIGRGLRTAPGKQSCCIIDHTDTHLRLGFVTDIHIDKLDDGKHRENASERKERETPLPKECASCHFLKPAGVTLCPHCGFKPERQSTIECVDGDLSEMRGKPGKQAPATHETKQRWYSMLLAIQDARGYKSGWAARQYREKFTVWPRGLNESPIPPDVEIHAYVKHRMIAYSRRKTA